MTGLGSMLEFEGVSLAVRVGIGILTDLLYFFEIQCVVNEFWSWGRRMKRRFLLIMNPAMWRMCRDIVAVQASSSLSCDLLRRICGCAHAA